MVIKKLLACLFCTLIVFAISWGLYVKVFSQKKQAPFNTNIKKDISLQDVLEAAENGNSDAQYIAGLIYYKEELYQQAAEWYLKSAIQGNAKAQFNLANKYYEGKGVEQNYKEAFKWYKKAAEQGHSQSQFNLGCMYGRGEGVKKDYAEANKWIYKAALQGNIEAQNWLQELGEK